MRLFALNEPLDGWAGKRVWIVGASTGIGRATAEALLTRGARVHVSARDAAALQDMAARWPSAVALPLDATDAQQFRAAAASVHEGGALDLAVYCAGHYSAMRATAFDLRDAQRHLDVNYAGALRMLDAVLPAMLRERKGHVALVGSVAGYRGLPLSLAYGPTKAALINLAQALYMDLRPHGVGVSIINPGFVETPLTAQNAFTMPALITPQQAAQDILRGWERGRFEIHFPRRFTLIMKALSLLPFSLYQAVVRRATGNVQ